MSDGFQGGRAAATIFHHPQTPVRVVVRGDDFTFAATKSELRKMRSRKCEWHDVKLRGILGSGKRGVREIEILGTSVSLSEEGLGREASGKRRRALLEGLGSIEESKTVNSTAVKSEAIGQEEDGEMLEETAKTSSGAWWRLARSDVHYAAKETCTKMASPTRGGGKRFKKACRYLREVEVTWVMRSWTHDRVTVEVQVDWDWAEGPNRKSRSGGMTMVNGTVVRQWSRTKASRALSTAEADYSTVVAGTAEGSAQR